MVKGKFKQIHKFKLKILNISIILFFRKIFKQSNRTCPICRGNASDYFDNPDRQQQQQQQLTNQTNAQTVANNNNNNNNPTTANINNNNTTTNINNNNNNNATTAATTTPVQTNSQTTQAH